MSTSPVSVALKARPARRAWQLFSLGFGGGVEPAELLLTAMAVGPVTATPLMLPDIPLLSTESAPDVVGLGSALMTVLVCVPPIARPYVLPGHHRHGYHAGI
jgi:hypothetical protein